MKLAVCAVSIVCLSTIPANAACTVAALAGTWVMATPSIVCEAKVSSTGRITGDCGAGRLDITTDGCRVTGVLSGMKFVGRTEAISARSGLKPNHILGIGPEIGTLAGFRK
jgi:hypothetical protein